MVYFCLRLKGVFIINIRINFLVFGIGLMNFGDGFIYFWLNFFIVGKFIYFWFNFNIVDLKDVNNGEVCKEFGFEGFIF